MAMEDGRLALISKRKVYSRCVSHAYDELQSFRSWLRWMCVDQSNGWTASLSWFVFVIFTIIIPSFSHFFLACSNCDNQHARPFDSVVQLSLSGIATLSFVSLSQFMRIYGLRRFLFFDKLCDESEIVRKGYTEQLNNDRVFLGLCPLPPHLLPSNPPFARFCSGFPG
ncbi:hypothetical protein Ccrd_019421 [Cynara cardunculus var. scolymus]|uniref:Uncharacterized protein n=1 Tax=Cynara cardunculus var. scolymus TaxID=59895 RepID=A0A124SF70_CYNCS|nr:hypothetical protein Ccrd_019421 [Cynara cardunculus var. scolymus]